MQQIDYSNRETYINEWRQEINNSEAIQNYLSGFETNSAESFIASYLDKKFNWYYHADRNEKNNEWEKIKWVDTAFDHLEIILQKKLFDVQCLWRAEKLTIPEISICYDFIVWENNVLNCPFVEPVNEQDIGLYMQYLQQNNVDLDTQWHFQEPWQDYEEIKEAYNTNNGNRNFPEWYEFNNGRTGTGVLMQLPDIRGDKEKFYRDLYNANRNELNKVQQEEWEKKRDKRPWLKGYDEDVLKYFVTTFENRTVNNYYNEYSDANRHVYKKEDIERLTDQMINTDEFIPIEAHYNWVEALEKALERYKCKKIAENLPLALEQYQMNIQMGIAFPDKDRSHHHEIWKLYEQTIIEGRKLNGEPEDLNF